MEFNNIIGGHVLKNIDSKVDVHNPDITITIEKINFHNPTIPLCFFLTIYNYLFSYIHECRQKNQKYPFLERITH